MLYPLTFNPIYKERVWGGRNLERLYGRKLPPDVSIGESWEIADRPEGVSGIANGPLTGKDLRWLMENHARDLLGSAGTESGRFPLLIKILDAQEKLSLQVHPPASVAARLGGEPKTEMWYIADARPGAELYVGLRRGVTRTEFERKIRDGTVADCFHRVPVRRGDVMFLPSGRVHAIGAGIVIFEIQQNSDTTYRVFDWNRAGLDGKPRDLHIEQSLECIDFNDFEPAMVKGRSYEEEGGRLQRRELVSDPLFVVEEARLMDAGSHSISGATLEIIGVLEGDLTVHHSPHRKRLGAGAFCLIPPGLPPVTLEVRESATFLRIRTGSQPGG
ncbi:MAG TPA: type I phosphomannose isomerase catalytic subunit [Verrucomicrobiae bacterium]|nr:type I phosphomannose isomerase catalytic subunit [Verrucomicrobiae bacterium]